MAAHDAIRARLASHQEAVILRDRTAALATLAALRTELAAHADLENRFVIPAYAERCAPFPDNPPEQFLREHEKLLADLGTLARRLEAAQAVLSVTDVIEVVESEQRWKGLFAHHDLREDNVLYPRLCAALGTAGATEFWDALRQA